MSAFFIQLIGQLFGFLQGNAMSRDTVWLIKGYHPTRFTLNVNRNLNITTTHYNKLVIHFNLSHDANLSMFSYKKTSAVGETTQVF
jgi:hypothetical protein